MAHRLAPASCLRQPSAAHPCAACAIPPHCRVFRRVEGVASFLVRLPCVPAIVSAWSALVERGLPCCSWPISRQSSGASPALRKSDSREFAFPRSKPRPQPSRRTSCPGGLAQAGQGWPAVARRSHGRRSRAMRQTPRARRPPPKPTLSLQARQARPPRQELHRASSHESRWIPACEGTAATERRDGPSRDGGPVRSRPGTR